MSASESPQAGNSLAQELAWPGSPSQAEVRALGLLLDDEFEVLKTAERRTFVAAAREKVPGAIGERLTVCGSCEHVCLPRFGAKTCRACGADTSGAELKEDSGFGFVLQDYGTGATAALLNTPAVNQKRATDLFGLADDRSLARALALDSDNLDWDELQEEIAARKESERKASEAAKRQAAEEAARRVAMAKAESERKAREEAEARSRAERAAREAAEVKAREEAVRRARAEAERKAREEAERKEREAAEAKRMAELEKNRPALGCVMGDKEGKVIRLPDLAPDSRGFYVVGAPDNPVARLKASPGTTVDGKPVEGEVELALGSVVVTGAEAFVVEVTGEIAGQVAGTLHLARDDKKPGGPWPFWNEDVEIGATAAIQIVDDGVADVHARMFSRFGVVVLADRSGQGADDGVFVDGRRRAWVLLGDGVQFSLGADGPKLIAKEGEARQKAGQKAKAMKPARHNRTVLEVYDEDDQMVQKVFMFVRREVRFGNRLQDAKDESRLINELALIPGEHETAVIAEKQGALALTRDGVDLRRDGGCDMYVNDELIEPGQSMTLKRSFDLEVGELGEDMRFEGRVFRSPSTIDREPGPARLGMKGGHPVECVRLDRINTDHTYVFLVRNLRIGSSPLSPLRLLAPEVAENHCQIMFSQGKFMIVSPREPVYLGDVETDPGIAFPLEINTDVRIGDARIRFRVVEDRDFVTI